MRTGKSEFVSLITDEMIDAHTELPAEQVSEIKKLGLTSAMIIPIGTPDNMTGALTVAYSESGRIYNEEDLTFFTEFCHHLTVLIDNAQPLQRD
jgi:GAF domain-containing protein